MGAGIGTVPRGRVTQLRGRQVRWRRLAHPSAILSLCVQGTVSLISQGFGELTVMMSEMP